METEAETNRLRWSCTHRSMLEMDLVLGGFFSKHYPQLSPEQKQAFAELVDMEDHDLWRLIMGKQECKDSLQEELVKMMKNVRDK